MTTFDSINSLVLVGGAFVSTLNIRQVIQDKSVKGLHLFPTLYFVLWGYWNVAYFYSAGFTLSFFGSIVLAVVNTVYISLVAYFKCNKPQCSSDGRAGD